MKYNNVIREAIKNLTKLEFTYLVMSYGKKENDKEENNVESKSNKIDIFM